MGKNQIVILFLSFGFVISLYAQKDNIIEKSRAVAANEFHEYHKGMVNYFQPNKEINYDSTFNHTQYELEYYSPFDNVRILLFTLDAIEPRNTVLILVTPRLINPIIIDSIHSVIDIFNNLLNYGSKSITNEELLSLPKLFAQLETPYHHMNHVLQSWEDIVWKNNELVDVSFKKKIIPPKLIENAKSKIIEFYYWESGSTKLYKNVIEYDGKIFTLNKILIGKYGQPHILI